MDSVTERRLLQIGAWCHSRFDDYAAIYDGVRSRVWVVDRFKDDMDDPETFVEAVQQAARHHSLACTCRILATGFDRDVTLRSTIHGNRGFFTVGVHFGWTYQTDAWFTNNIVGVFMDTDRLSVSMNLEETSEWRRAAVPCVDEPLSDCFRRDSIEDVGPLRESEIVSLIASLFNMDLATCVEKALVRSL